MALCNRCTLLSAVAIVLVAWYLYVPVWEGYSQFSMIGAFLSVNKLGETVITAAAALGVDTKINLTRKYFSTLGVLEKADGLSVEENLFNGVKVRIYRPLEAESRKQILRGMVYYHGGGWVFGNPKTYERFNIILAKRLQDTVIVSVDYRLAPEHPFPAPIDDCATALEYLFDNAAKFNVDPSRIGIMGDSAGGNLVAAVTLKLREKKAHKIKLQVMIYPALQAIDFMTPSYQLNREDRFLPARKMPAFYLLHAIGTTNEDLENTLLANNHTTLAIKAKFAKEYLKHDQVPKEHYGPGYQTQKLDIPGDAKLWKRLEKAFLDPLFAPLLADNLSGLPPALIVTCQYDVLRDDGIMYAKRLHGAGNKVQHEHVKFGFHALLVLPDWNERATAAFDVIVKFLEKNL